MIAAMASGPEPTGRKRLLNVGLRQPVRATVHIAALLRPEYAALQTLGARESAVAQEVTTEVRTLRKTFDMEPMNKRIIIAKILLDTY